MASAISQALVDYAEELEELNSQSGLNYLKALRDRCLSQIQQGFERQYVSTTVDGQSFTAQVNLTAAELLPEVSAAIKTLRGEEVKMTIPHFYNIPH